MADLVGALAGLLIFGASLSLACIIGQLVLEFAEGRRFGFAYWAVMFTTVLVPLVGLGAIFGATVMLAIAGAK